MVEFVFPMMVSSDFFSSQLSYPSCLLGINKYKYNYGGILLGENLLSLDYSVSILVMFINVELNKDAVIGNLLKKI